MHRTSIFLLAFAFLAGPSAHAQNRQSDRLAALLVESNWKQSEQMISVLLPGLTSQMLQSGIPEKATEIFVQEIRTGLTRKFIQDWISASISDTLDEQEILDVVKFYESPVGQKYRRLADNVTSDARFIVPLI